MKKLIFNSLSVVISMIWLIAEHQTYNPISLKGPEFLKFYMILLLGFYISVFGLKFFSQKVSKTEFYFMIFILILGIIKLIKGLFLGKPIGYLLIMVIFELIIVVIFILFKSNNQLKYSENE